MTHADGEPPLYLYKFRSATTQRDRELLRSIVVDKMLWFASPTSFNDPFDCSPAMFVEGGSPAIKKYLRRIAKDNFAGQSRSQRLQMAKKAQAGLGPNSTQAMIAQVEGYVSKLGICCFSGEPHNILQWSHYANSHQGVCLRFRYDRPFVSGDFAFPVTYADERPKVDVVNRDPLTFLKDSMLTKATLWSYEREYRVLKRTGRGLYPFDSPALDAIIIGCRATSETRSFVDQLISQQPEIIRVMSAKSDSQTYSLRIDDEQ